jgi:signal transduction histidine kinase
MKNFLPRLSLAQQFMLLSSPILLAGTLVIGWWIGEQVEDSVVRRIGGVTALYVDSFVAPHVQSLADSPDLTDADRKGLAQLLDQTPLGKKIISLKIWAPDGQVLYSSSDASQIGHKFAIDEGLADALGGSIYSEISDRNGEEEAEHGGPEGRVIETYTPLHADRQGRVIAAAEFYQSPEETDREAGAAQRRSWLTVAGTMLVMYLMLFVLVRRGSETIDHQQHDLSEKVMQLTELNAQNSVLHQRVKRAAERTTAMNENFLQRISADIHDGPGQDLGFALMRLKSVSQTTECGCEGQQWLAENLAPVQAAVQAALTDLRAISGDLQLPDIDHLTVEQLAGRVVRDYESKTTAKVGLQSSVSGVNASERVKITLYRLLQESLANAFHHAKCENCRVILTADEHTLRVEVADDGPGFDLRVAMEKGRLGLAGMRERVEVLGGTFELVSGLGKGTTIRASLPLISLEEDDG